jgi:hypothetical protein
MSALGYKRTFAPQKSHVCFTSESGHEERIVSRPPASFARERREKSLGSLAMTGKETNREWQGDGVCGGRAPREHVLDRAGATKLLRW